MTAAIYEIRSAWVGLDTTARRWLVLAIVLGLTILSSMGTPGMFEATANNRGHFKLDVQVGNKTVKMMLDTGATSISLAPHDAKQLGIDLDTLTYDISTNTANGQKYVAETILPSVEVGNIVVHDVRALVHRDNLNGSLLGMSFLRHLDITISDGELLLEG